MPESKVVTIHEGRGGFSIADTFLSKPPVIERQSPSTSVAQPPKVGDKLLPADHRPEQVGRDIEDSIRLAQGEIYEVGDLAEAGELFKLFTSEAIEGLNLRFKLLQRHGFELQKLANAVLGHERYAAHKKRRTLADNYVEQATQQLGVLHENATEVLATVHYTDEAYQAARLCLDQIVKVVGPEKDGVIGEGLLKRYKKQKDYYYRLDAATLNPQTDDELDLVLMAMNLEQVRTAYSETVDLIHSNVLKPLCTMIGGEDNGAYTQGVEAVVDGFRAGHIRSPEEGEYARLELLLADAFMPAIQRELEATSRSATQPVDADPSTAVVGTVIDGEGEVPALINPAEMEEFLRGIGTLVEWRKDILEKEQRGTLREHLDHGQATLHADMARGAIIMDKMSNEMDRLNREEERRWETVVVATAQHIEALDKAVQALELAIQKAGITNKLAEGAAILLNAKFRAADYTLRQREKERTAQEAHAAKMGYLEPLDPEKVQQQMIDAASQGDIDTVNALSRGFLAREAYERSKTVDGLVEDSLQGIDRKRDEEIARLLGELFRHRQQVVQDLENAEAIGVDALEAADAYIAGMVALYDGLPPVPAYIQAIRGQETSQDSGSAAARFGRLVTSCMEGLGTVVERHRTIMGQAVHAPDSALIQ